MNNNSQEMALKEIPALIRDVYSIVKRLEGLFPGRKFTPDGHLVGSLGEVLASYEYALELLPNSTERHDAKSTDGRNVQVKATQINSVAFSSKPDYLIVLIIYKDGSFKEIYNGPGSLPWNNTGPLQKNGQKRISLAKLKELNSSIPESERIPKR